MVFDKKLQLVIEVDSRGAVKSIKAVNTGLNSMEWIAVSTGE